MRRVGRCGIGSGWTSMAAVTRASLRCRFVAEFRRARVSRGQKARFGRVERIAPSSVPLSRWKDGKVEEWKGGACASPPFPASTLPPFHPSTFHRSTLPSVHPSTPHSLPTMPTSAFFPTRAELRELLALAAPVVAVQVGLMLMGVVDSIMVGAISAAALAARHPPCGSRRRRRCRRAR